jgi:hypothetical protein
MLAPCGAAAAQERAVRAVYELVGWQRSVADPGEREYDHDQGHDG